MRRTFAFIPLSLLALAACGDGATSPTDISSINADVASAVADGVGGDVSTMRELNFGLRHGGLFFPIGRLAEANCPYNGASGWHECEAREAGPVTVERRYAFYNAGGTAQETYDADLTASIRVQRVEDGSMDRDTDRGTMTGSIHHERDLTVSGLAGAETQRTWNGTGHSEIQHTHVDDNEGSRAYEMTADVVVHDVIVPHPGEDDRDPWPLSGTITTHVVGTATRDGETKNFERTVVITFDGTQFAKAVVNGTGGSGEFTIDLANRRLGHRP